MFSDTNVPILLAVVTAAAGLAWMMSKEFSGLRDLIADRIRQTEEKIEQVERVLMEKMEYHERHDDVRFADVTNAIWETKLHNLENKVK